MIFCLTMSALNKTRDSNNEQTPPDLPKVGRSWSNHYRSSVNRLLKVPIIMYLLLQKPPFWGLGVGNVMSAITDRSVGCGVMHISGRSEGP